MSSYYSNGPRIFTPSTLKTSTQFIPIESFGTTAELPSPTSVEVSAPAEVNTCHRSRGAYLQQSHPRAPARDVSNRSAVLRPTRAAVFSPFSFFAVLAAGTFALLRRAEAAKTEETAKAFASTQESPPSSRSYVQY